MKNGIKKFFHQLGWEVRRVKKQADHRILKKQTIGKFQLLMPADHALPEHLVHFPNYSQNLPRLVKHLADHQSQPLVIDVGANVGDTVALIHSKVDCPIVCIEGDPDYFAVLKQNLQQFSNVRIFQQYLGATRTQLKAAGQRKEGTLNLVHTEEGNGIQLETLDHFYEQHPELSVTRLLKTDTDGFDFLILRGGMNFIEKTKPVLFLEYDPYFYKQQAEGPERIFDDLIRIHYNQVVVYDNYGNFLTAVSLKDKQTLNYLTRYLEIPKNPIRYYDLCLFHENDQHIADKFIQHELKYFNQQKGS